MRYLIIILSVFAICLNDSCTPDEEIITADPEVLLGFSTDTISFDTVFTSRGSVSKRLLVHNRLKYAVSINRIYLGGGRDSQYDLVVEGRESNDISNVEILGKDSLLILVSATVDPGKQSNPFVVRDSILFQFKDAVQDVKLIGWGRNAHFLGDSVIRENTRWTAEKPYFLTGSILVDSLITLSAEPGVQVYISNDSYIFIKGSLKCRGSAENRISFLNERLEHKYDHVPGQWGGVFFLEGSHANLLEFTDIRNALYGIRVGTPDQDTIPDVVLKSCRIENTVYGGIMAFTSDIYAENTLVNSSAYYVVANLAGGSYRYNHCTFVNFPFFFQREGPSVAFTNYLELDNDSILSADIFVSVVNSIIWGSQDEELAINKAEGSQFTWYSENCILKTTLNISNGGNNFLSTRTGDLKFRDADRYDYTPDSLSPAIDKAFGSHIKSDLFGNIRDSIPDIGAIELLKQ